MKVLLDTNLLLRLAQPEHPQCSIANSSIALLESQGHAVCIVPQIVYEFYVVITRPISQNGLGLNSADANNAIDNFLDVFVLLRDERGIFARWRDVVQYHSVLGKPAHDARLVAAMQRHNIQSILSFNAKDFQRYSQIHVIDPMSMTEPSA